MTVSILVQYLPLSISSNTVAPKTWQFNDVFSYRSLGITCTIYAARDRQPIGGEDRRKISPINEESCSSRQWSERGAIRIFCVRYRAHLLLPRRHSVGMSAACRVPLRAFASPAAVIGQTPKASISGASFHTIARASRRKLPVSSANTAQLWASFKYERKSLAAPWGRCFSTSHRKHGADLGKKSVGNKEQQSGSSSSQRGPLKYLIVLGVLGVGAVVFSDEIQHAYRAAARSGRVVGTLAVCINE